MIHGCPNIDCLFHQKIDRVVNMAVNFEEVVRRLSGRRQCRKCGENFHVDLYPSKKEGLCDRCEGQLFQRDDDQENVIRKRLEVYQRETSPLIDYYSKKGLLKNIKGDDSIDEVFQSLLQVLA